MYISRLAAPFHHNHSTEVTVIDSPAAYSTASDTTLVPLCQGTKVTSVTGAFSFERPLHIVYGERIQSGRSMSRSRLSCSASPVLEDLS